MILKIIVVIFCSLNGHFSALLNLFLAHAEHFETCLLVIHAQKRKETIVTPEWSLIEEIVSSGKRRSPEISEHRPSICGANCYFRF